ncbi:C2 family cysteine protease [Legionella cherrii]|nr:C2 family cysteine protease [Legionella cherrii]
MDIAFIGDSMLPLNFKTRGSLVVPANIAVPLVFPGVRGKIKKTIQLPNDKSLEENSLAIIQPLNLDKPEEVQRFRLTPYLPIGASRDDLPENQRNITIDEKASCEVELDNPEQYLGYNIEQYQQSNAPLFGEGSPSIEDVKQYKVPDCFFLASLAAILSQPDGASYIRSMLRQNDDGTTTVRLFNPKTLEPVYVRVQNSYIVDQQGSLNKHTGLWVDILEKAAASVPELFGNTNPSMSGALKGGSESTALKILTGCNAKEEYINYDKFFAWDIGNFFADELEQLTVLNQQKKIMQEELGAEHQSGTDEIITEMLSTRIRAFEEIFGQEDAQENCLKLIDFYSENKEEWERIYSQYANGQQRLEHLIAHFSQDEKNIQIIDILQKLFIYYHEDVEKGVRRDNQEIFSGIYSPEELSIFNDIKLKIAKGESLTAGTPQRYDEKVPGLRAMHAYTIVDVVETIRPVDQDTDERRPIKMIRIRNPWGFTGRLYLPNMENPNQIDIKEERVAGTFDLELKDFCRYYESYTSTQQLSKVRELTTKRERLALKMQDLLKGDDAIAGKDSQHDLLPKIDAYFECKADLINIQITAVQLLDDNIHEQIKEALSHEDKDSLNRIIEANKVTMMNIFQTSDCELIAASINYWWKDSNQQLSKEDEKTYQHQLIQSFSKNDLLWSKFIENYQINASLALRPFNKSQKLIDELLESIEESKQTLQSLLPNDEGYEQLLKALFLQTDLLKQHFSYLEKNEKLLQRWGIELDSYREKLANLKAYIEDLVEQNPIAERVKTELEKELPQQSSSIDDFTRDTESLLRNMAGMELILNKYKEIKSSQPASSQQNEIEQHKSKHFPQWLISLGRILDRVLEAITRWKSPNNTNQEQLPGYNRRPASDSKYPGLDTFGFFERVNPEESVPSGPQDKPTNKW